MTPDTPLRVYALGAMIARILLIAPQGASGRDARPDRARSLSRARANAEATQITGSIPRRGRRGGWCGDGNGDARQERQWTHRWRVRVNGRRALGAASIARS